LSERAEQTILVLLRHGESFWNRGNRFTGWTDVDLTAKGIAEAQEAGQLLREHGILPDMAFTSVLTRAIRTLWIVLEGLDRMWIPVQRSWRLNERHYGALQGLNKEETARKHGDKLVHAWRRSFATRPPALSPDDKRFPGHDPRYRDLTQELLPTTESLQDTVVRFLPYWHETIVPVLQEGRCVLIVAHGNSLRALVKHLERISDHDIPLLNIPTGSPLIYTLDNKLRPESSHYLGDPSRIEAAQRAVADQASPHAQQEGSAAGDRP